MSRRVLTNGKWIWTRQRTLSPEVEARLNERLPWPEREPLTTRSCCAIVDFDGIGMESVRPRRTRAVWWGGDVWPKNIVRYPE